MDEVGAATEGLLLGRVAGADGPHWGEGLFIALENDFLGLTFEVEFITKSSHKRH